MDENRKYKDETVLEEIKKVIAKREDGEKIEIHAQIKDEGAVIEVFKDSEEKNESKNACEYCEEHEVQRAAEDFLTFLEKILTRG